MSLVLSFALLYSAVVCFIYPWHYYSSSPGHHESSPTGLTRLLAIMGRRRNEAIFVEHGNYSLGPGHDRAAWTCYNQLKQFFLKNYQFELLEEDDPDKGYWIKSRATGEYLMGKSSRHKVYDYFPEIKDPPSGRIVWYDLYEYGEYPGEADSPSTVQEGIDFLKRAKTLSQGSHSDFLNVFKSEVVPDILHHFKSEVEAFVEGDLTDMQNLSDDNVKHLENRLKMRGQNYLNFNLKYKPYPTPDWTAPSAECVAAVAASVREGEVVFISCGAGRGRTGYAFAIAVLTLLSRTAAIQKVLCSRACATNGTWIGGTSAAPAVYFAASLAFGVEKLIEGLNNYYHEQVCPPGITRPQRPLDPQSAGCGRGGGCQCVVQ